MRSNIRNLGEATATSWHASHGAGSSNKYNLLPPKNAQAGGQRKPVAWMANSGEIGPPSCERNTGLSVRTINAVSRMGSPSAASNKATPGGMTQMKGLGSIHSQPRPRRPAVPHKPLRQSMRSLADELPTLL